jgi:SAM-dependent methyltransferase
LSEQDRERWNRKYATASAGTARPLPSLRWIPRAPDPGAPALDLACGRGRHVGALLDRGYRVVAADGSIEGLRRVPLPADRRPADLQRVQFDSEAWPFATATFALILQTDFLERAILKDIVSSTQPGGLILIDTFAGPGGSGAAGPSNPAYRLRPGELGERFADWEVLEHKCENDREAILVRKRGLRT